MPLIPLHAPKNDVDSRLKSIEKDYSNFVVNRAFTEGVNAFFKS